MIQKKKVWARLLLIDHFYIFLPKQALTKQPRTAYCLNKS